MKKAAWIPTLLGALVVLATACTNKQGETEAPVFITVGLPQQPLVVNVNVPAPVQIATINLASHLKNPSQLDPEGFANVQVSFYTVQYFRQDGGTRVPAPEQFAVAGLLPSGGTLTLTNYAIMAASAVQQSPFDQLLSFNGGFDRETGLNEIHIFYHLTFFGDTVAGQRVQSETATGDLFFQAR
jgi:hypothetical protein